MLTSLANSRKSKTIRLTRLDSTNIPTAKRSNWRCKSTRKLALTLYSDKTNQSILTRIYIRRARPTNPYKQGYIYIRCQALKRRYFVWIAPTDISSNFVQQQKKLITRSKRAGTRKQATQPQHKIFQKRTVFMFTESWSHDKLLQRPIVNEKLN